MGRALALHVGLVPATATNAALYTARGSDMGLAAATDTAASWIARGAYIGLAAAAAANTALYIVRQAHMGLALAAATNTAGAARYIARGAHMGMAPAAATNTALYIVREAAHMGFAAAAALYIAHGSAHMGLAAAANPNLPVQVRRVARGPQTLVVPQVSDDVDQVVFFAYHTPLGSDLSQSRPSSVQICLAWRSLSC